MVQELDVKERSAFCKPLGNLDIILAGFDITGGVIVYKGDLQSIAEQSSFNHIATGEDSGIHRSHADELDTVDEVPAIEANQNKHFSVGMLQEFHPELCKVLRVLNLFGSVFKTSVFDHMDFDDVDLDRVFFFHVFFLLCVEIRKADQGKSAF
jgi:hypothetical protein